MNLKKKFEHLSLLCVLAIFLMSIGVKSCYASEAIADYKKIMQNIPEYSLAKRQYDEDVLAARKTFDARIKKAKNDSEKQQLQNQYEQFCSDEKKRLFAPLLEKMKAALREIASENGYTKISSKDSGVIGVDITEQAIARLNTTGNKGAVLNTKVKEERKIAVEKQPITNNVANTQPAANLQPHNNATAGKIEVQFGAGYNKSVINSAVAQAKQNGIKTAYVAEAKDKAGKTFWRARACAKTTAEAQALSAKLSKIGLKNFIAR